MKTELIDLRAVVTDKQGRAVADLAKEEFEVLENGKAQELSFFSEVRLGERGGAIVKSTKPAGASAGATASGPLQAEVGRTIVLYVDTLHLSTGSLLRAKQSLREFVDRRLTDQDLTAIVTSAGSLGVVEQFTRDRRILRRAIDRLAARPTLRDSLFTPYLASLVERQNPEALEVAELIYAGEESIDPLSPSLPMLTKSRAKQILQEATYLRRAALLTLRDLVTRMSSLAGQRLVVMLSDGFTLFESNGALDSSLQTVTSAAARSGVVIYSISARGLQPPDYFDASRPGVPVDPDPNRQADLKVLSYATAGERDLENGLNALARDTGGEPFFNTNDTVGMLGKILDDNRAYYTLAYYPTGDETDRKFRKIAIRIRNHPEYQVRAQRGYVFSDLARRSAEAEAKTPQQRFVNAILAPLPETAIGVSATAQYLEIPEDSAQVTLTIHLDGNTLTYREENGRYRFETEVAVLTFNSEGKRVEAKTETVSGLLPPDQWALAKQNGFRYVKRLSVKPGLYQIRVGVREPAGERMGTAAAWIETADLQKNRLTMSSLILNDAQTAQGPTAPAARDSIPPSKLLNGIRYYRQGQPVLYAFRLYNTGPAENEIELQIEIVRDGKTVLSLPWRPASARILSRDAKGWGLGGQLTFPRIEAGLYELRASLRTPRLKRPILRSVSFGIEP